jgi:hypothetical protein
MHERVGGAGEVTLQTGPWIIHLSVLKEGRFPQVDELLRRPEDALTRWQISPSDAEFLGQGLVRLRTAEDEFQAVTIDLHKGAVIRAAGAADSPPTELVLCSSPPSGQELRIATDRRYLARALRLGFRELLFYGEDVAAMALDGHRQYLWAPLEHQAVVAPSRKAIRVESSCEPTTVSSVPSQPKRSRTVPKAKTKIENGSEPVSSNGQQSNGQASSQEPEAAPTGDTLVAEALALKQSLQDALTKTNSLIAALKRQGRQSRLIESTLRSLRQFQAVTG